MTNQKLVAALLGAAAAIVALPAAAQVDGIATASPVVAVGGTKAFAAANGQITTQYKTQLDQADAKQRSRQPLLAQLDKNGDKNVDDSELAAAEAAKSPVLGQLDVLDREIGALTRPAFIAQAYALEQILPKYDAAQATVVAARKISVILTPNSFVYAPATADVTSAITAELDRTVPTVSVAVPASWQPQQQTVQLLQQILQISQMQAARAAGAAGTAPKPAGATPAPAPATPGKKPAGR